MKVGFKIQRLIIDYYYYCYPLREIGIAFLPVFQQGLSDIVVVAED